MLFFDITTGDVICSNCGLIIDSNQIDQGAEWRAFNLEESDKKTRVGVPSTLTLHDKGLTTIIDWRDSGRIRQKIIPKKAC